MWNEVRGLREGVDYGTPPRDGVPVTLTVDGVEVTVPEGSSVMLAAAQAQRAVPKLCATDLVEAFGSCRVWRFAVGRPGDCHSRPPRRTSEKKTNVPLNLFQPAKLFCR